MVWLRNRFWNLAVAVICCEVVRAVLVSCGGTPIHPFVNPPAESGSRLGRLGPDTEYSAATVPRTLGRLNQENARQGKPSPSERSDWPCVHGDLSFTRKEGRCNRLSHYSRPSCCSKKVSLPCSGEKGRSGPLHVPTNARSMAPQHQMPSPLTPVEPGVFAAAGRQWRRVRCASPCAK